MQLFINFETGGNVAMSGGFLAQATGYSPPVYIWRFIHTQIRVLCPGESDGNITFFDWNNVGVTQFADWGPWVTPPKFSRWQINRLHDNSVSAKARPSAGKC